TFPGHDVAAFDDGGKRLADRHIGELWVSGPSVAQGYYEDPVQTEKVFGNGWLKTGDLGYTVDGNVYIVGRKKDIIIINGRNYDPQRIEWLCDDVAEVRKGSAVAFSRPGTSSEELIVVLESRTENQAALKESVSQRINEHLALTPADIVICDVGSLPKTSSGKLQRAKTRQQYLAGTVGKEGNRTVGGSAERLVLARHVALSLLGRTQHRAKRIVSHTLEIRSMNDAVSKLSLVRGYVTRRVGTLLG
ncbi:MAG: AMP-binding protein, partial [Archangium sp.]|nr:AMP-binding protein [Archangium sp.]